MKYVPKVVSRTVAHEALRVRHHSPALLFGAGVVGLGATVVLAVRATLKVEEVLLDHAKDMSDVNRVDRSNALRDTSVDYDRERRHITVKTALRLSKLYAPTAVAGVVTLACLTGSHRQLTNRNTALTAAYVGLQRFLDDYRGRVREEIGSDREKNVYYASTPVELVEDTKNGPKKVFGSKPGLKSPYAGLFMEGNPNWQSNTNMNIHFIRLQADFMTQRLRANGHLFLNEIYDALAMPRTPAGQLCGWAIRDKRSDDFVDIEVIQTHDHHGTLMLDFNVAGDVMDMAFGTCVE
jgi:hypothetical protein